MVVYSVAISRVRKQGRSFAIDMELWWLAIVLFPTLILVHLYQSPYTKVEESFNVQATHDILAYGFPTNNAYLKLKANYDHMTYPGAVPRTFVGALVLAGVAKPLLWMKSLDGKQQQILGRLEQHTEPLVYPILTLGSSPCGTGTLQRCCADRLCPRGTESIWRKCSSVVYTSSS